MTTITPPEDSETIQALTDTELERELTLATLSSRRARRFELLLRERRRRRAPLRAA